MTLDQLVQTAPKKELIRIYYKIESRILEDLNKQAEKEAFKDLEKGNIFEAESGTDVIQKCLD